VKFRTLTMLLIFIVSISMAKADTWNISGNHKSFGQYTGTFQLIEDKGKIRAIRLINYNSYQFAGKNIQEIWDGSAKIVNGLVELTFNLKQADFIQKFEGLKRTESDKNNLIIKQKLKLSLSEIKTSYLNKYFETYSRVDESNEPIYEGSQKVYKAAHRKMPFIWKFLANKLLLNKYKKDSFVSKYKNRPEFKNGIHTWIYDKTDLNFYKENPNIIRITNKVNDRISLLESYLRSGAYSYSLEEKEQLFFDDIFKFNVNNSNMITYGLADKNGESNGFMPDGDSALWTSYLLGTLLMKYNVTGDYSLIEKSYKLLNSMFLLIDVTGNPETFARALKLSNGQDAPTGWVKGKGKFSKYHWLPGGNNDMGFGILYSFLMAYKHLPYEDLEIRDKIRKYTLKYSKTKLAKERRGHRFLTLGFLNAISPKSTDPKYYKGRFLPTVDKQLTQYLKDGRNLLVAYEKEVGEPKFIQGIADWSGNQLMTSSFIIAIESVKLMLQNQGYPKSIRRKLSKKLKRYKKTFRSQMRKLDDSRSAMLTIASKAYSGKYFLDIDQHLFKDALDRLREIPYLEQKFSFTVDHSISKDFCLSPIPKLPWKLLVPGNKLPMSYGYQSLYSYPLFELNTLDTDNYIWKNNPLSFKIDVHQKIISARLGFLNAYWTIKNFNLK